MGEDRSTSTVDGAAAHARGLCRPESYDPRDYADPPREWCAAGGGHWHPREEYRRTYWLDSQGRPVCEADILGDPRRETWHYGLDGEECWGGGAPVRYLACPRCATRVYECGCGQLCDHTSSADVEYGNVHGCPDGAEDE